MANSTYRKKFSNSTAINSILVAYEHVCMECVHIIAPLFSHHTAMLSCLTVFREYLLEVKVRLLEQLSCGFNSPQLAIEFIQMLLEEYSKLCNSLPALLYLLKPLVCA